MKDFPYWTLTEQHDESTKRRLGEYPANKDWYKDGYVTTPYDQGACGGCWAFSSTSAVEALATIAGVVDEVTEFSIQQLLDCDTDNFACTGGWMYQGFAYISGSGILKKTDYRAYSQGKMDCDTTKEKNIGKAFMKDIGYVEHDGRTNAQLVELLQNQNAHKHR